MDLSVALWCLCGAYANCFAQCLRSHWGAQQRGASNDDADDDDDAEVDAGRAEPMPRCSFNQLRRRRKHNIQYIVLMNMYIHIHTYMYMSMCVWFTYYQCTWVSFAALSTSGAAASVVVVLGLSTKGSFSCLFWSLLLAHVHVHMYIYVLYKVCCKVRNENSFKIAFKTHLHRTDWMSVECMLMRIVF